MESTVADIIPDETDAWAAVRGDPTTAAQRRALYRLSIAPSLVAKLDRNEAALMIASMIQLRTQLGHTAPTPENRNE